MTEELKTLQHHNLLLEDRKRLKLTGVTDVDSFDDSAATAYTVEGELQIAGEGLRVLSFNNDLGELLLEGTFRSFCYLDNAPKKAGLFARLLR